MTSYILIILSIFIGVSACKVQPKVAAGSAEVKMDEDFQYRVSHINETRTIYSTELFLRSVDTVSQDQTLRISISSITDQSLKLDVTDPASKQLIISKTIPRYFKMPNAKVEGSEIVWKQYFLANFGDFRDRTILHTVALRILDDNSALTIRIETKIGEKTSKIEGSTFLK